MRSDYRSRLRQSCLLRAMDNEQNQNGQYNGNYDCAVLPFAAAEQYWVGFLNRYRCARSLLN
jgi:hypothetical protein